MAEYTLTLDEETDAVLAYQTEQLNLLRLGPTGVLGDGPPLDPLTPAEVLVFRLQQVLVATRLRLETTVRPVEAMLLPLTPAQRVALIQRIPSAAVRQRIIDLLRDR